MKNRAILLALTAVVALLVLPLAAGAQQANEKARNPRAILTNPRLLARYLKLTPDQVKTEQQLFQELKAKLDPLREARKTLRETFHNDLAESTPNPCTVGQDAIALHDNAEAIKAALQDFDTKFSAILTPEQLTRYQALKAAARLFGDRLGDGT
jgi:Spy/CpxP family protein refolding chaperone